MYKIFFEDNLLILDDDKSRYPGTEHIVTGGASSFPECTKLLQKLQKSKRLVIIGSDKEVLKKQILSLFRVIPAAGGLVTNAKDEVLMIHRRGRWDLPKGWHEEGETLREGALREVGEECGIIGMESGEKITTTYHIYKLNDEWCAKETHWYAMKYDGPDTIKPQTEEDITEVAWLSGDRLNEALNNTYPTIIDVFSRFKKDMIKH